MRSTAKLLITRVTLALLLFTETVIYAYLTFCGHLQLGACDNSVQTPRPLFYYYCTCLAATALATAISVSCCCLDRSRSERMIDALVYSFITALIILAVSQLVILIVLLLNREYRSKYGHIAITVLLFLSVIIIVIVKLQHYFIIIRIRGYSTSSSSSGSGGTIRPTLVQTVGGLPSPPTKAVYVPLKQPDPEMYARLKDNARGQTRAHTLNMYDYYQVPDDRHCCKPPNPRKNSVEV